MSDEGILSIYSVGVGYTFHTDGRLTITSYNLTMVSNSGTTQTVFNSNTTSQIWFVVPEPTSAGSSLPKFCLFNEAVGAFAGPALNSEF